MPISPLAGKGGPAPKASAAIGRGFCPAPWRRTRPDSRPPKTGEGSGEPRRRAVRLPSLAPGPDTETLPSQKGPIVPGSEGVHDTRPLETRTMPTKPPPTGRPQPTVARFLLDGPVLPLVTGTLRVAEALPQRGEESIPPLVPAPPRVGRTVSPHRPAGPVRLPHARRQRPRRRDPQRPPARLSPAHRRRGRRPLVYLRHRDGRRRLWPRRSGRPQWGSHPETRGGVGRIARATRRPRRPTGLSRPLLAEATVWVSATPFVVTRYPKLRGTKPTAPRITPRRETSSGIYFRRSCSAGRSFRRSWRSRTKST